MLLRTDGARSLILGAALVGAVLCGAPSAGAASGVTLRYHFTPGQQTRYQATIQLAGSDPAFNTKIALTEKLPFTQQVQKVYADGSAQLLDSFSTASLILNGQSTTMPLTNASATAHVTTQGVVLTSSVTGLQSLAGGLLNLNPISVMPVLPLSQVVVGSHWTANQRISLGTYGAMSGALHYKVLALGPVNGHTVATMQAKGTFPLNVAQAGTPIHGTATGLNAIQFDADQGALISAHSTITAHASLGAGNAAGQSTALALTLHVNVDRLP